MRYEYDENKVFTVEEEIQNIVDWIKKYFVENGPDSKAVIGISGGKDSTIAAALCVEALGKERVIGVLMPQGVQADIEDARKVCKELDIKSFEIDIGNTCAELYQALDKGITEVVFDRGGYVYHGRVQVLADSAREAGLKF
jgi:NAD+ synthase